MARTTEELERAAEEARAALDALEVSMDDPTEDASDLRDITQVVESRVNQERALERAVVKARANGRSWAMIGLAMGVSRQAARDRFGKLTAA
jgi:hypothetical protein